ncbi:TetR/AcrR family transcriptional regulator (plasmid) [Paracoccus liaowanqingii]|uniref:TetR/AcrR family transcriptional regulator n=1 Tax=Paracoccus liaowanqingii TaxID=2560053 RepID=A0A4Y5SSM2_9RHOB|nr:TetR family transcriptional regulator [Paracoccus liaowanqingii]QDA36502.1 TetR/AcrR family transcriptional regulator [Paracoccus liaowanqingii]
MEDKPIPLTGWRGSRDGWLSAGYRALIKNGVDAVKIMPLAKTLGLSRTSFYWFFQDRDALLTALLDLWTERTTRPLIDATRHDAATQAEAMLNVIGCFISDAFDSRLEFAVRSWALQDPEIAERVKDADSLRLSALSDLLLAWGHDTMAADVRARTVYLVQIGYISMQSCESLQTRLARIPSYVEIYTGTSPHPHEITRFSTRFQCRSSMADE